MEHSDIILGLEVLTRKSIDELNRDMENYKLLETNIKDFLIHFFRKDIESSVFIRQIFMLSPKAVSDFQEHIFIHVREYFNELINIEGISFSYNPEVFPLIISISLSEMILCNIDIYGKKIEILEDYYFRDIITEINKLNNEKDELLKKYEQFNRYANNTMDLLKDNKDMNILQSIDVIISSSRKKKNKYKAENEAQCMIIESRIMEINKELEEYFLIESVLRKNMLSINYYQNKIADRLSKNLLYKVVKN